MLITNQYEHNHDLSMPSISDRAIVMPESPIRKLAPLASSAKERGIHVYHLNIGQPDVPTPEAGLNILRHIDRKVLEYSPSQGFRSYRENLHTITKSIEYTFLRMISSLQLVDLKLCCLHFYHA